MNRTPAWPVSVGLAFAALAACTGSELPDPSPSNSPSKIAAPPVCGGITPPRTAGNGSAYVPIGPLAMYQESSARTPVYFEEFDRPRRIEVVGTQRSDLTLTGQHCANGRALRFWFGRGDLPTSRPGQPPEGGETRLVIAPLVPPDTGRAGGLVFLLFDETGNWQLTASEGGQVVGTAVIEVATRGGRPS